MTGSTMTRITHRSPRRTQLLDAAVRVVGRHGLRGLTHRAVDREAGVPEGTCSVSYRTRLALLTALTERVGTTMLDQVRAMGEVLPPVGDGDRVAEHIDATIDLLTGWLAFPEGLVCIFELGIEAVRTPSLQASFRPWREHLLDHVEAIIARSGKTQTRLRAQAVVASIEGALLMALNLPEQDRETYLRRTLTLIMGATAAVEIDDQGGPQQTIS